MGAVNASISIRVQEKGPRRQILFKTCFEFWELRAHYGWLPSSNSKGGCLNPVQANLNEFHSSNIHIYPYGISDKEGNLFFEQDKINLGKDRVIDYEWNVTTPLRVVSLALWQRSLAG